MKSLEFLEYVNMHNHVKAGSCDHQKIYELSGCARKIAMELNSKCHTQEKIGELFSKLTDKKVDGSFRMLPTSYTDCRINIPAGKNVLVNACCNQSFS